MKTLVYIGVNKGYGLSRLLQNNQFDIVYAFEPDPELFDMIRPIFSKYPLERLSKTLTFPAPCFNRYSTILLPTKPAPPVIK